MKNFISASIILAAATALPLAAQAQGRMTNEELIAWATAQNACGEDLSVLEAQYESETSQRVVVRCGEATGFVPLAGAVGLGGAGAAAAAGLGLAAIAAGGGGGSTGDTQ